MDRINRIEERAGAYDIPHRDYRRTHWLLVNRPVSRCGSGVVPLVRIDVVQFVTDLKGCFKLHMKATRFRK